MDMGMGMTGFLEGACSWNAVGLTEGSGDGNQINTYYSKGPASCRAFAYYSRDLLFVQSSSCFLTARFPRKQRAGEPEAWHLIS
jgi:hypothetical protein